jgi:UDP-N-acetylmuramyl pentapeptide synthase
MFGHAEPPIFNVFAWLKILLANERIIRRSYNYDVAVLELGTDGPGQLADFAYLQPDIVVLTAIAEEHMEFFGDLDAVAKEELTPITFAKQALVNIDDVEPRYRPETSYLSYGVYADADYHLVKRELRHQLLGQELHIALPENKEIMAEVSSLGEQGAKSIIAAAGVADLMGWTSSDIQKGLDGITPVAGRMQVLSGASDTTLIDDTYNASPVAIRAALDVLTATEATERIAILGTMNELGEGSADAHQAVGAMCDPKILDLVVTIGEQAERYLAPVAQAAGCHTVSFASPYDAGRYVKDNLKPGTVVLAKGSQNGVFAEEAVKLLLQNPKDSRRLVRQSPYWLQVKRKQFPQQ